MHIFKYDVEVWTLICIFTGFEFMQCKRLEKKKWQKISGKKKGKEKRKRIKYNLGTCVPFFFIELLLHEGVDIEDWKVAH